MTSTVRERLPAAYWRLWTASTISNLGDGVFLVALPLLAARLTRSEISISLVSAAATLPWLILSLPIGALIDRADRKRVMIAADSIRALVIGGLAVLTAFDVTEIWMLWIVALTLGVAEVFFDNASQAIVPAIVPASQLQRANGLRYAGELTANTFIGTPIGSLLFAVAIWLPFGLDAATYVLAVLLILPIKGRFHPGADRQRDVRGSLYSEIRTGMRWLWRYPLMRALALSLGLSNLGFQVAQALFVLYAQEELGIGERAFGFLVAAMGLGAILGGLLGERIVHRLGASTAIKASLVVWIITLLIPGFFPITVLVAFAASVESAAASVWNVVTVSLRQQIIPPELFGRVNSVYRWLGWGTIPIGAVIGGQIAHAFGLRSVYFVGAAFVVVALVLSLREVTRNTIAHALASVADDHVTDPTPLSMERDDLLDP